MDLIAEGAAGAVRAELLGVEVHVLFEDSGGAVEEDETAYEAFDVMTERYGNALVAWSGTPDDQQRDVARRCLVSATS
jgi:hypothetical protein